MTCVHSCWFVHTVLHSIFFSPNTHFHTSTKSTHTCALKRCGAFYGGFPGPQHPGLVLPSQLLFPSRLLRSSLATSLSTTLPNLAWSSRSSHPGCLVRLRPSSHPPSLTITPLAPCSKHTLSVTPLCEDATPVYQMRTLRLGNISEVAYSHGTGTTSPRSAGLPFFGVLFL